MSSTARPPPTGHRPRSTDYGSTRACPLLHLQLILREGGAELTYIMAVFITGPFSSTRLFSRYTDAVTTG